jgi:hypothetical protein
VIGRAAPAERLRRQRLLVLRVPFSHARRPRFLCNLLIRSRHPKPKSGRASPDLRERKRL